MELRKMLRIKLGKLTERKTALLLKELREFQIP